MNERFDRFYEVIPKETTRKKFYIKISSSFDPHNDFLNIIRDIQERECQPIIEEITEKDYMEKIAIDFASDSYDGARKRGS